MSTQRRLSWAETLAVTAGLAVAGYGVADKLVRRSRYFDLLGRTAIVTGGSRGIGLCIARELVDRGARVAICARDEQGLAAAEEFLTSRGGDVLAVKCDVTQADEIANVVAQTRARFGPVDVLVNNAGQIGVGPAADMTLADFRDAMDTNYEGPLLFILDVLPEMRRRGEGRIVNVASFGGKIPSPHLAPYAASKHALVGLSESLRAELIADGVYVTTVCPGLVRSGSAAKRPVFKGDAEAEKAWFVTGDVTPGLSIDPNRLARQIVDALQHGDAELITPLAASLQAKLHGLLPGLTQEAAAVVSRFLPKSTGNPHGRIGTDVSDEKVPAVARSLQNQAEHDAQFTDPSVDG